MLCRSIMSNTESEQLADASTDANGDSHICAECNRHFRTNRGLNKITDAQTPYDRNEDDDKDQTSDDSNIEIPDISTPSLR